MITRVGIQRPTPYLRCPQCKVIFQSTPISEAEVGRHYPDQYSYHRAQKRPSFLKRVYAPFLKLLIHPLERYCPTSTAKKLSILDVGCARGGFLKRLLTMGFEQVEGIEVSASAVDYARGQGLNVSRCSLEEFNADGRYDIITLNQVFEHFRDPHKALSKLSALLSERGEIIMSFPNGNSLTAWLFGKFWPGHDAPRHYFTYNPASVKILCRQHGLKVARIKFISRPSQFTGSFQYIWNHFIGGKAVLEFGYFRNSILLDLLFFPVSYLLNFMRLGDMIEVYIKKADK